MFWLQVFVAFFKIPFSCSLILLCLTSFAELHLLKCVVVLWPDLVLSRCGILWKAEKSEKEFKLFQNVRRGVSTDVRNSGSLTFHDRELSRHYSSCFQVDGVSKRWEFSVIHDLLVISRIFLVVGLRKCLSVCSNSYSFCMLLVFIKDIFQPSMVYENGLKLCVS